jgi:hypothetical protein
VVELDGVSVTFAAPESVKDGAYVTKEKFVT